MRPVLFALALSLILAATPVFAQSPYVKVPAEHWAYNSLEYLVDAGYLPEVYNEWVHGRDLNHRDMEGLATILSQMVLIGHPDGVEEGSWDEIRIMVHALNKEFGHQLKVYSAYDDVPKEHWSYEALDYLCREGVLEGYPEGFFTGERTLTRYEFAQAVARLLDSIGSPADETVRILADALRNEYADQLAEIQRGRREQAAQGVGLDEVIGD